jgi:3-deoxy-D-manno-octulosonic-acid transferase
MRIGAAIQVQNGKHLAESLDRLLDQPAELVQMGQTARSFVLENQDAVARNLELIEKHLPSGVNKGEAGAAV